MFKVKGGPSQRRGVPDLIVCYRGRFMALEVKRPGGKPTPLQAETLGKINTAGGITAVVRSELEVAVMLDVLDDSA